MVNVLGGTTYIISFELGNNADKNALIALFKSYGTWGKITENTWAVLSITDKSKDIRAKALPYLGTEGRIFVIKSGFESAWSNVHAKSDWLKKYLEN